MAEFLFSRSHVELVNRMQVDVSFDYAVGDYLANKGFYDILSNVQKSITTTGKVTLQSGVEADVSSAGGLMGLQLHMQSVEAARTAMAGLAKLGLSVEKQLWKLQ